MSRMGPKGFIALGVFLMLLGVVLPLLMVMQVLTSTYFLNFFSFTASMVGLILAIIGLVMYTGFRRRH